MKKRQLIKIVNRLERDITFQETAYHCYNPLNLSGIAEEYLRKKYKVKYFFISDFSFRSYYSNKKMIKPYKDCEQYSRMLGWDEGYEACAQQRISEQEGWQTGEPSEDEGPFLLDLGDHQYRLADIYISATPNREPAFRNTSRAVFPYTFSKYVKRWKLI